jgi:pimeloyl-ACP methyl ester carboxylesterase
MKPKIILAHGFAASTLQWKYQTSLLKEMGYEVFTKDLLGHGNGIKPIETIEYTIDNLYIDFSTWLFSLAAAGPLIMVGHSLGAYLTLKFAIENPSKVRKIILVSPLITKDQFTSIPSLLFRFPRFSSTLLRHIPGWLISHRILNGEINSHGLDTHLIRQVGADYKRVDSRICYFGKTITDLTQSMSHFSTSSLIIWGDKDNTLKPNFYFGFSASSASLTGHRIKNGGHNIHLTHKEEVNEVIAKFLNQ